MRLVRSLSVLGLLAALNPAAAQATVVGPDPSFSFDSLRIGGCFQSWFDLWWDVFGDRVDLAQEVSVYSNWNGDTNAAAQDHMLWFYDNHTGLRTLTATVSDASGAAEMGELRVVWDFDWQLQSPRRGSIDFRCQSAVLYLHLNDEVAVDGCVAMQAYLGQSLSFTAACQSRDAGEQMRCEERGGSVTLNRVDELP